jgi:hypothetical protein
LRETRPTQSIFSSGEANEFASGFAACTVAAFGSSMMTFDALGPKQSLKEQLVGTWTLLSWEQRKGDGTKLERYGTNPKGIAFRYGWAVHHHCDAIRSSQIRKQRALAG